MTQIQIKGAIVSDSDKWLYDFYEMESTAPKDILLPQDNSDIEVVINSGGGDVYAGSEIYTALKSYQGNVAVKIVGIAASAASVIAMAGKSVEISPTAQIMIHNVSTVAQGDSKILKHEADVLENYNKSIANAYVLKTGLSQEELLSLMDTETWLTAGQAVEKGFADKVMFAEDEMAQMVASNTEVLPQNFVKMQNMQRQDFENKQNELIKRIEILENALINKTKQEQEVPKGFGAFTF
ncbi:head maturation protease, ClpP-related [Streptococcus uberis]|uniref:head maturation protease, ClpP-related n=1 Tax=Streptococcus uberis TaxID=1349 RepID=UPI0038922E20